MISVIICTYTRSASLKATLTSLSQMPRQVAFRWELIVVDNNSDDDTAAVVRDFSVTSGLDVRYVLESMQGLSHARNRGIREARGDILVFTDDDVLVDRDWLLEISNVFAKRDCLAAGGKVLPVWDTPKPRWFYEERPFSLRGVIVHFDLGDNACEPTVAPFGANIAFRRIAFTKYGFFRTDLGRCKDLLRSGDETEFFQRLFRANEKVSYTPKAIVYHPVPKERLQKAYAQSFFYNAGKTEFRVGGIPQGAVCYFGVPRFLFRTFAESFFAWTFSLEPKRRFRNKLRMYHTAGMIAESRGGSRGQGVSWPTTERT